jgi:low affinity Fe/Cu permease
MGVYQKVESWFERMAAAVSRAAGSFWAFGAAALLIIVWALSGPIFHFSEVWQLVINTGTTIVTFLMVFVIQHSQNKDTRAMQLKLNEIILAIREASNRLIDVEELSDEELEHLGRRYSRNASAAAIIRDDPSADPSTDLPPDGPGEPERSRSGVASGRP